MASSLWLYFIVPSLRYMAYVPAAIVGMSLSASFVMAVAFITSMTGQNKVRSDLIGECEDECESSGNAVYICAAIIY